MSKNPFVNCKSRKRRKPRPLNPIVKDDKRFCPRTFVRYDNTLTGFSSIWTCKMCLTCVLNENAVAPHIVKCNAHFAALVEKSHQNDKK